MIYKILRGHNLREGRGTDYIVDEGVLAWGMDTNELFIGDGKTMIKNLKGINNVCKAPNGRLYAVDVDNFGHATVKPLKSQFKINGRTNTVDFYAE